MSTAFPTEIWIIILCDVLGTYFHSLVLLPPRSRCWHGYSVVRRLSKRLKAIADDIWLSAVGSEETWREVGKLRSATLTGKYDGPESWCISPLISAYGAYILGLILEDDPLATVENAIKAYELPIAVLGKDSVPINWFLLAAAFSNLISPHLHWQVATSYNEPGCLIDHVDACFRLLEKTIKAAHGSNGSEEITFQLESGLAMFEEHLRLALIRIPLDHTVIATLKELVRNFPPSEAGDDAKTAISINRRKLAARVTSFTEVWSQKYEASRSHKIAMHRAAS